MTDDPYGTIYLGNWPDQQVIATGGFLGPITDSLKKFDPLGWYVSVIPVRKHWWFLQLWKPKTKFVAQRHQASGHEC